MGAGRPHCVQSEVQLQHIDSRLAQHSQVGLGGVLRHDCPHLFQRKTAGLGNAGRLELGILQADGALVANPYWVR